MPGKRRRPAPKRKARSGPKRTYRTVMATSGSHHDLSPGGWMPFATTPQHLKGRRNFAPLDYYEEG